MDSLLQDLRYAVRSLRKTPGFSLVVVLALGVGIGASTVMFSVVDHVLLRPLAYPDPGRLVAVRESIKELSDIYPSFGVNASHYLEWQRSCTACGDLGLAKSIQATLSGQGEVEQLNAVRVSANLWEMLGARMAAGRAFARSEDRAGGERVVILSDALWRRRFGRDSSVVGRSVMLNDTSAIVVGVVAAGFQFPRWAGLGSVPGKIDVFMPLALNSREATTRGEFNYVVIARLASATAPSRMQADLDVIEDRLTRQSSDRMTFRAVVAPLEKQIVGSSGRPLALLVVAVGAVLAIVCVNLASLVLARNLARRRDSSVRVALGARRGRLVRQTLTETLVLSLLGGGLGVVASYWGLAAVLRLAPANLPRLGEVRLDARVLACSLLLSIVTGIVFGAVPALRISRSDPGDALRGGGRGVTNDRRARRTRDALIGSQVALSTVLLISAGLLIASFERVLRVDKGFSTDQVMALDVSLPATGYESAERRSAFYADVLRQLGGMPGVRSAALTTKLPLEGESQIDLLSSEHDIRPVGERPMANIHYVSPEYFGTLGVSLRKGRMFSEADRGRSVVLLSERAARTVSPTSDAVGMRVEPGSNDPVAEVIGVVSDVRTTGLENAGSLIAYVPYWQRPPAAATLVIRATGDPAASIAAARSQIRAVAPTVPITGARTMTEVLSASVAQRRFQLLLLSLFAVTALMTASIGIYGIVAQSFARRSNEIGLRLAMGAGPGEIRGLVLREGLSPAAGGIVLGLVASLVSGRLLANLLFQVRPADPVVLAPVIVVLALAALVACWMPARRAARVDPAVALRSE